MKESPETKIYAFPELPESWESVILPIDKYGGWTSFDVIKKLRRLIGVKKIGHAGTLDPMATGLLICLFGKSTKLMTRFQDKEKTYSGVFRLGEVTATYDAESEVLERKPWQHLSDDDLNAVRKRFVGVIEQYPPMFSAVKVGGERLYKKARRGEEVERLPRTVNIHEFDIMDKTGPDVHFQVKCSKGTYIRALAHDFGTALGVGAHLISLRRTAIGDIDVNRAWTLTELESAIENKQLKRDQ